MEDKLKHLEMIENVIQRMANNSFQLKGWAVTIVGIVGGLSANGSDKRFFLLTFVPLVMFWFLDTLYLQLERKYRVLYDNVRVKTETDFSMNLGEIVCDVNQAKKLCYCSCLFSRTEAWFYIPIIAAVTAVAVILKLW